MAINDIKIEDRRIKDMRVGEREYSVPWCLLLGEDNRAWLNINYPIFDSPGGTVELPIKRVSDAENGYDIDIKDVKDVDHEWEKSGHLTSGDNLVRLGGLVGYIIAKK